MAPKCIGGKKLLDLEARNEAILLVKAAGLAELDPGKQAPWAALANHRLSKHIVKSSNVAPNSIVHSFVQTWHTSRNSWPLHHRAMLKCIRKYGLTFNVIHPTPEVLEKLPLWHHIGKREGVRDRNNYPACKCLRDNHNVLYVGDAKAVAARLEDKQHLPSAKCMCLLCCYDRRVRGCENPHACVRAAASCLDILKGKWDPRRINLVANNNDTLLEDDLVPFRPPLVAGTLTEGVRVLTNIQTPLPVRTPPRRRRTPVEVRPQETTVKVYIAGAAYRPPKMLPEGLGAVYLDQNKQHQGPPHRTH